MLKKFLTNDLFIAFLILLNGFVLFFDSFQEIQEAIPWLDKLDLVISVFFLIEMIIKINDKSFGGYLKDSWNKVDFVVNIFLVLSFYLVYTGGTGIFFLTILRLIRLSKFFRVMRFVPKIDHLMTGIGRAMKASVFIFIAFLLYLFIISILSCFFFREVSPEHFGNPLLSLYSTFKIFTIEGWFELPELISAQYGIIPSFFVKIYFIFLVLTGGVLGMSLVNAIFVDELVADNNDEVLAEIKSLREEIQQLKDHLKK